MTDWPRARAGATIDLGAIERNCARLATAAPGAQLCAVVKADGYGHGAVEAGRAALAGGARWLAVAAAAEALELRRELPQARILILGALSPGELELAFDADADLAAWRSGFIELIRERARARGIRPRLHLKYDTGMGRLGEPDPAIVSGLADEIAAAEELELTALWTHFATADEPGSRFFETQLERFRALAEPLRERYPGILLHAANSAATLREPRSHFDLVRCGVAVYGLDPFGEDPAARELEPALELRSYVADIKPFAPGASAGYGRRWRATEPTNLGVIPIGYGDGVRRALSNNAQVLVGGRRRDLVGTISMDNITVDLGAEPQVEPGAEAVLIGAQGSERVLAEELARRLGTINYEITCGVSPRVPREYKR